MQFSNLPSAARLWMEDHIFESLLAFLAMSAQPAVAIERPSSGNAAVPTERTQPESSEDDQQRGSAAASRSRANLVSLFRTDDYPKEAWQNGEQGMVDVTLTVGVDGKVADCVVNRSSGSASLDVQTCRILWTRARFTPARDAQGNPVRDTYRQRIRWELPAPDPTEVSDQYGRHIITVDSQKAAVGCRYESSPAWQMADDHCSDVLENMRQFVSTAPDWVEFAGRELVLETQHRVGEPQGGIELGEQPGESRLALSRLYLTIDAAGKVKSCSRDSWGAVRADAIGFTCEGAPARWLFQKLPARETNRNDRQLTVVTAIYLRRVATSLQSNARH